MMDKANAQVKMEQATEQLKEWNNIDTEEKVRDIPSGTEILLYNPNANSASAEFGGNNNSDGASNEKKMETEMAIFMNNKSVLR